MSEPLVIWVTSAFPFGHGEQFIEPEVEAWRTSGARVVFLPIGTQGERRELPEGFEVDETLARSWASRPRRGLAALRALLDPLLRSELADLRGRRALDRATATIAWRMVVQARLVERAVREVADRRGQIDVVYTYWLKPHTSGAVLAREAGAARKVVSRCHNTDLYEEARPAHYNALVRTVATRLDRLYSISDHGVDYLKTQYGFLPERVTLARLGVDLPGAGTWSRPGDSSVIELLSVSTMTPMKRLDLMVEGIARAAEQAQGRMIRWRHFGAGPLRDQIEPLMRERLDPLGVEWHLCGQLPHDELLEALVREPVDMLLNVSSSEGVPVSIMEAQVRGIPCLATDVGATREVVGEGSRYLLPSDVTSEELAGRILELVDDARTSSRREAVRDLVVSRFDRSQNFPRFVADVLDLARAEQR